MKAMTLEQLHKHALRTGAEVSVDGKTFNSARAQVVAPPTRPPAPPPVATAAAAPAPDMVSRDVVDSMLREQAAQFEQQFAALRSLVASGNPNESGAERDVLGFRPTYDAEERIVELRVVYEGDSLAAPFIGI